MLFKANQMPPVLANPNSHSNPVAPVHSNHFQPVSQDVDLRAVVDPRLNRNMDMDMRSMTGPAAAGVSNPNIMDTSFMRQMPNQSRPMPVSAPFASDPRQRADPRVKAQQQAMQSQQQQPQQLPNRIPTGIPNDASDQEKAALIMQVLQLSDEQIAMLPPEQRASILVLKEQIAKSTQR